MNKVTCYNTIISLTIKGFRESSKKSQKEMAELLGITSAGWGKLEKGKSTISASNVLLICDILEVSFEDFYGQVSETAANLRRDGWDIEKELKLDEDTLYQIGTMSKPLTSAVPFIGSTITVSALAAIGYKFYTSIMNNDE